MGGSERRWWLPLPLDEGVPGGVRARAFWPTSLHAVCISPARRPLSAARCPQTGGLATRMADSPMAHLAVNALLPFPCPSHGPMLAVSYPAVACWVATSSSSEGHGRHVSWLAGQNIDHRAVTQQRWARPILIACSRLRLAQSPFGICLVTPVTLQGTVASLKPCSCGANQCRLERARKLGLDKRLAAKPVPRP